MDDESQLVYNQTDRKRASIAVVTVMVLIVVSIAGLLGTLYWAVYFYDGIYPNITFSGTPIGGMTREKAKEAIGLALSKYTDDVLEIRYEDMVRPVSIIDAGVVISEEDALDAALQIGRTGTAFKRVGEILRCTLIGREVLTQKDADNHRIIELLAEFETAIARERADATYKILEDSIEVRLGVTGKELDVASASQEILNRLNTSKFDPVLLDHFLIKDPGREINLLDIHQKVHVSPENACLDAVTEDVAVVPHIRGVTFDLQAAEKLLDNSPTEGSVVRIPLVFTEPEVTTEAFEAMLFRDELASTKTTLNAANLNRTGNVRLSASAINGKILKPGEVFSYNETVGERTYEQGYKDASVYVSSGIEDQLGGGICQTSSTLYMSILRARLEIVERYNHSYTVVYAPLGEDATVYWGSLDFKFANSLEMPIKIIAFQEKDYVVVKILGTKTDDHIVKIETLVLSHTPYTTSTVLNPDLAHGKTVQKVEGHSAYSVETYRVIYDSEGNELERIKLPNSRYKRLNRVLEIGTKGAPTPTPAATVDSTTAPTTKPLPTPTAMPSPTPAGTPTPSPSETPEPSPIQTSEPSPSTGHGASPNPGGE